jgi:hypothetical protein
VIQILRRGVDNVPAQYVAGGRPHLSRRLRSMADPPQTCPNDDVVVGSEVTGGVRAGFLGSTVAPGEQRETTS